MKENYKVLSSGRGYILGVPKTNAFGYEVLDKGCDYEKNAEFLILEKDDETWTFYKTDVTPIQKVVEGVDEFYLYEKALLYRIGLEYYFRDRETLQTVTSLGSYFVAPRIFIGGEAGKYLLTLIDDDGERQEPYKDIHILSELTNSDYLVIIGERETGGLYDLYYSNVADYDCADFSSLSLSDTTSYGEYDQSFVAFGNAELTEIYWRSDKEPYKLLYRGSNLLSLDNAVLYKEEDGETVLIYFDKDGEKHELARGDEDDFTIYYDELNFEDQSWECDDNQLVVDSDDDADEK